jgi:serine/threonine protein kinase
MLQEAILFASINNEHIVHYNNSWIEVSDYTEVIPVDNSEPVSPTIIELESPYIEFATSEKETSGPSSEDDYESSRTHPHKITKISLYIQMELCKETLEDYVDKRTFPLIEEEFNKSLDIARQLIEGIRIIHTEYKVIHRDLSLRNIFIGKDNKIKIGDFGLATKCHNLIPLLASPLIIKPIADFFDEELDSFSLEDPIEPDELTHGLGTKTFAAPEQMSDLPYDQKADIYSLGLILLALLYPTQTLSERQEVLVKCRKGKMPKEFLMKCPEIGALIERMTCKDPQVRPTAEELLELGLFSTRKGSNDWSKLNITDKKLETPDRFEERCIKIIDDTLSLYKNMDKKAKLRYPLYESLIASCGSESKLIKKNRSYLNEDLAGLRSFSKSAIEHPHLETLEVTV